MDHVSVQNRSVKNLSSVGLQSLMMLVSGCCIIAMFWVGRSKTESIPSAAPAPSAPGNEQPFMAGSAAPVTANRATGVSDVVTKALAFKGLLTTSQQSTLEQTYTSTLARKWSNLPCGATCRNGIQFGTLTAAQLAAALDVIKAATGSNSNDGYDEFMQIRLAEANLHANGGGSGYDTTLRWIAFLNTPSPTGAWMLQFGGHHYAANIAFNNGHVIGATPFFMGLEPLSFTINSVTYHPLNDEHDALTAMLASLTTSELASAKLTSTFSDCTMVPGETNGGTGTFPTTKVGIACSTLTTAQKNLVLAAISHYVNDMDTATAAAVMAVYTNEINGTYIGYTGSGTSGDASTFLNANSNYVRIDGPTVWIELACQNGVIYPSQIHYHTVWRDHSHDYGVDLSGAAIDGNSGTSVAEVTEKNAINVYPNPANTKVTLALTSAVNNANISVISAVTGQRVSMATNVSGSSFTFDISSLASGLYILRVEASGAVYTSKFSKL